MNDSTDPNESMNFKEKNISNFSPDFCSEILPPMFSGLADILRNVPTDK
jgi:hypothetical protein